MEGQHWARLVLRADLRHGDRQFFAHTTTISADSMFVRTDEPVFIGDRVGVTLSFPGLVDPIEFETHVVSQRFSKGPGDAPGLTLAFVFRTTAEQNLLARLIAGANPARRTGSYAAERYRVLLVEDSALSRDVFSYGLERYFGNRDAVLSVATAKDADAAWQLLTTETYDLAIVDYFLPEETGAELIARIRAHAPIQSLPVVAVSVGGTEARTATLSAGGDLFLDKPLVLVDLFSTLEHLTTRQTMIEPRKRVLIVDDSALMLDVARQALSGAGYDVLTAQHLDDVNALRRDGDGALDLILMDVQMPELFGDDVAMVLRQVRGISTPIYLLSDLEVGELSVRCADAGLDGYISKRGGVTTLVARVDEILGGGSRGDVAV